MSRRNVVSLHNIQERPRPRPSEAPSAPSAPQQPPRALAPRAWTPRAPRPRPPALELGARPKHPSAPMPRPRPPAPRPTQAPRFPPEPPWPVRRPALFRTSTGVLTTTRPRPLPPGPLDPEDLRDPQVSRTARGRTALIRLGWEFPGFEEYERFRDSRG